MTTYNDKLEDALGRIIRPILANTAKDGSGTWYIPQVDSSGRLVTETSSTVTTNTTGTGVAIATLSPGAAFQLVQVRFNVSTGAPLAAAETLTITADIDAGAAYDNILFSTDLGTASINDVVVEFGKGYDFAAADDIVIALSANAGGDTWGCQTIHKLI